MPAGAIPDSWKYMPWEAEYGRQFCAFRPIENSGLAVCESVRSFPAPGSPGSKYTAGGDENRSTKGRGRRNTHTLGSEDVEHSGEVRIHPEPSVEQDD